MRKIHVVIRLPPTELDFQYARDQKNEPSGLAGL